MKNLMLAIVLMFSVVGNANANVTDVSRSDFWLNMCKEVEGKKGYTKSDSCIGFIRGVKDTILFLGIAYSKELVEVNPFFAKGKIICEPDNVTTDQFAKIWVKYLDDNPNQHHKPAIATFLDAVVVAFPCK